LSFNCVQWIINPKSLSVPNILSLSKMQEVESKMNTRPTIDYYCSCVYFSIYLPPQQRQFLGDRSPYAIGPLSCMSCPVCDVVYCSQTAGWIKMPLGTEVGLGPRHTVLDEDPAPPPTETDKAAPHFSAHVCCGQTVAHLSYCSAPVNLLFV